MPGLIIWKNQEFDKLRKEMDRMFDRLWGDFGLSAFPKTARGFPAIDLMETADNLIIKADVSGINPKDIDIAITESSVILKGQVKQDLVSDKKGYHKTGRRHSTFSRTLKLPCRILVNDARASYKKGILSIIMPKYKREKARVVKIET